MLLVIIAIVYFLILYLKKIILFLHQNSKKKVVEIIFGGKKTLSSQIMGFTQQIHLQNYFWKYVHSVGKYLRLVLQYIFPYKSIIQEAKSSLENLTWTKIADETWSLLKMEQTCCFHGLKWN